MKAKQIQTGVYLRTVESVYQEYTAIVEGE